MIDLPHYIDREFIRAHRNIQFLYGKAVHKEKGWGQAFECLGESNCFGIPVRWSYCQSSGWFSDNDSVNIKIEIDVALSKIDFDKPIVVLRRLGCGRSRMNEFAPKTHKWLMDYLAPFNNK